MFRNLSNSRRTALALTLVLAACGTDNLAGLKPKLVVRPGTPMDGSGHYLLDFGTVNVGSTSALSLIVENEGRVTMTVQPPEVASPFSGELSTVQHVSVGASLQVGFLFGPVEPGPAETTVTLTSDGGNATVILRGNGANPQPPPVTCSYKVNPTTLDFGNVQHGQSKTDGVRISNTGTGDCQITQLALSPTTDAAFTIPGGVPSLPLSLSAGDQLPVGITFAPTHTGRSFAGTLQLTIGPPDMSGTADSAMLQGSSVESCPNPQPDGSCPPATAPIYLNDESRLFSYDPMTHTTKYIGAFNAPGVLFFAMYDIAVDSSGVLAGVSSGTIYIVNPNTAACSQLFVSPDTGANGLTFLPDGRLVIAGAEVNILDRSTGHVTNLVPAGKYTTSGDIVGLPDGLLYWTVGGPNGTDLLVTVDPTTGATNEIGDTGVTNIWGLSYANNLLYGFTDDGRALVIDSHTAQTQAMSVGGSWYGAATNPATW